MPTTAAPPAAPPSQKSDSLDRSALSGVAWSGGAKWASQIIAWASTIIVARVLTPDDYGLIMMASVFMGILSMLSEFGIGTTVINMREIDDDHLQQLNGFALLLGLTGSTLAALCAIPLGQFFRAPDLPPVLAVIGLTYTIMSLHTVPTALLRREMKFRLLALIDVTKGFLLPIVTLIGALAGMGHWALVTGSVAGASFAAIMTLAIRRVPYAWPRIRELMGALRFSRDVLVGRVGWIIYQNGDFAVAARQLGQGAAGVYSLAWMLATSPIEKVTVIFQDVTPSLFSAVQHDRVALRRYFLNLTELICLATFPASVGIALVSQDLVTVLLGPKWEGTGGPLAFLALYAGARSVTHLFGILFTATRQTRFMMWSSLALATLLVTGFIVGSFWGAVGIAAAWLVVHPGFSVYSFSRIRSALDLSGLEYLKVLRLGVDGSVIMAAAVLALQSWAGDWSPALRLPASILVGAATFGAVTWALHRRRLREILDWFRRIRTTRGRPPAAEPTPTTALAVPPIGTGGATPAAEQLRS